MSEPDVAALRAKHYNATLTRIRRLHDELMIVRARPDHPIPPFKPGQYAALGLGYWERRVPDCQPEDVPEAMKQTLVRRAFSISSPVLDEDGVSLLAPEREDFLEFYVTLVRYGEEAGEAPAFTPRIFGLNAGDRIWVSPKITGHYLLDPLRTDHNALFCATGTGEAPHNRMLWHLLRSGHSGRLASVVCCRFQADLGYRELHEKLVKLFPPYRYTTLTTREKGVPRRYIQDLILTGELEHLTGIPLDPDRTHVFLCGNPAMIGIPTEYEGRTVYPKTLGVIEVLETLRRFRADRRGAPGNIHFEKYW